MPIRAAFKRPEEGSIMGLRKQAENRRKRTRGALWEDTNQCTVIENGRHLWNGLLYVELNMVRAGAVKHPAEWRWSGYAELTGQLQRFRTDIGPASFSNSGGQRLTEGLGP